MLYIIITLTVCAVPKDPKPEVFVPKPVVCCAGVPKRPVVAGAKSRKRNLKQIMF